MVSAVHPSRLDLSFTGTDALTIDVEDWFHIVDVRGAPPVEAWSAMPSRVERNCRKLLDMLAEHDTRATCFFLGWVAEKFPQLVRAAAAAGHEIASHGYSHQPVYELTEAQFFEDVRRTKESLEQISGRPVHGYRAPSFSLVARTPWAFERLAAAGYRYDASIFPGARGNGGLPEAPLIPTRVETRSGTLLEFPVSMVEIARRRICFFGGGYLRLFPYGCIRAMTDRVHNEGRFVVFYLHPREIDPDQPRLSMSLPRRFKSYVNLRGTEAKLLRLLRELRFEPLSEFFERAVAHSPAPPLGAMTVR
jgi:polysaccharide deacetylase family protein (PEP-CTERM system associated)